VQHGCSYNDVKYNIELNFIGVSSMIDTMRGDYLGEWRNMHMFKNAYLGHAVFAFIDRCGSAILFCLVNVLHFFYLL